MTNKTNTLRTVADRDFLIGSVWEGTGEEIHVNRHYAEQSEFGGRILSGISGMLLTIGAFDPSLIDGCPSRLEWSFNGALLEGDQIKVNGTKVENGFAIEGRVGESAGGRPTTCGSIFFGELARLDPFDGRATRGRTFTAADIDLFRSWFPSTQSSPDKLVPWPMLVLLASGLISRSGYLGHHELTLNRGYTWTFSGLPEVDDTLHCVHSPVRTRVSNNRPDLKVGSYDVNVVSSVSGRVFATADWTVMFR